MTLQNYFSSVLTNVLKKQEEYNALLWHEFERIIGNLFLSILRPFIPNPQIKRDSALDGFITSKFNIHNIAETGICLGAVNFRGLYQRNGRQTILEPCGSFLPSSTLEDFHSSIHETYLNLASKSISINQLFLVNTPLDYLAVKFDPGSMSTVTVSAGRKNADIILSDRLINDKDFNNIYQQWDIFFSAQPLNEKTNQEILTVKDYCERSFRNKALTMIKNESSLPLLSEWFKLPQNEPGDLISAVTLFEEWLRSIFWLRFYCREAHAGSFFYTIRLPQLLADDKIFPDSSLSIVSKLDVPPDILDQFKKISYMLSENKEFKKFKEYTSNKFKKYVNDRLGNLTQKANENVSLAQAVKAIKSPLSIHFNQLEFLLKMTRKLVGQKHEGTHLKFCFIFGFSKEMIDAESKGLIDEHSLDLRKRWDSFYKILINHNYNDEKNIADAMSIWIKNNDLQLQPFDVAVYFEENPKDKWPIPTSILRLKYEFNEKAYPVSSIVQLHLTLRKLTSQSKSTVGVITARGGLIIFIGGKSILIPCNVREKFEVAFVPELWDLEPIELKMESFLKDKLQETFCEQNKREAIFTAAAHILNRLIDTIVTLGYGAMIIVRTNKGSFNKHISPLNPVWSTRTEISEKEEDYVTFALMAALDGAAEFVIPDKGKDNVFVFHCRKFIQTTTHVWQELHGDEYGDATLTPNVEKKTKLFALLGKGTRHHSAFALSCDLGGNALVITVSADGPVNIWRDGKQLKDESGEFKYAP